MADAKAQFGPVLVDRPVTRRIAAYILVWVALLCITVIVMAVCLMQRDPLDSSWTWVAGMAIGVLVIALITCGVGYARLYSERYVVTAETIEITSGILRRDARKIPFSRVLDVTTNASFDRRLFGVGNITVAIANGDTVTFEDITDAQTKAETLWQLVRKT
jgi:putative membrane protein